MRKDFRQSSLRRSVSILCLLVSLALGGVRTGTSFSLLGPYAPWQVTPIGYNLPGDIGGPMRLSDGYRWNVPVITYGFDPSFIGYFGTNGIAAVEAAFQI